MPGLDYGNTFAGSKPLQKLLPFNKDSSAWWNPGESEFLFGGGATKGMNTAPQSTRAEMPSSVRCVPIAGIRNRTGTKVPTREPIVESA